MDGPTYNYGHFDDYVEHGGERAPGFEVVRLDDGARFDVADLWRRRDVVMEFGSFT